MNHSGNIPVRWSRCLSVWIALSMAILAASPSISISGGGAGGVAADKRDASARDKAVERQRDILSRNADAITKLQELIATGKHREAFNDLMQLRQILGEPRVAGIEAMAAEVALIENRPDQAWRFIQAWSAPPEVYDRAAFRAYICWPAKRCWRRTSPTRH